MSQTNAQPAPAEPRGSSMPRPVRIAVVGCGAIARLLHIPVLAGHEGCRLAALVDRDLASARELGRTYGVESVVDDASRLDPQSVDAALIATPPKFHAAVAIELLRRGLHVLVEKPMAFCARDAEAMVAEAAKSRRVLAAGYFRRLFPGSRTVRALLASGVLGRVVDFHAAEGSFFTWPSLTLGSMTRASAGGGVLIDTGSHTLDQLLSFFDGQAEVLECRTDAIGGVEADCSLRLRIRHQGVWIEGGVELSRTRKLPNLLRVRCERAVLELPTHQRVRLKITPTGLDLRDPAGLLSDTFAFQVSWEQAESPELQDAFRAQIDDWLTAIWSGGQPYLSGASALPTVRLIEEAYGRVRPLEHAWVQHGLADASPLRPDASGSAPAVVSNVAAPQSKRRILVTGASGFIGGRLVEILSLREKCDVRALIHSPANASRLARLPVELVQADLLSPADVDRAVASCDAVVHCAYGTSFVRREAMAATIEGTRRLAEAVMRAGVRRFIHLSTTAVNGTAVTGVVDECTPLCPDRYDYAIDKARAETEVARAVARGCPAVVLRLPNVYGPFSRPYTIRSVDHLLQGVPVLVGEGAMPSNTVYVDNVVEALLRAIDAPDVGVVGEIFTLNDDQSTWAEFMGYYARAMGCEMRSVAPEAYEQLKKPRSAGPLAAMGAIGRNVKQLAASQELKALAQKVITTDPLGYPLRMAMQHLPGFRPLVRKLLKLDRPEVYRPASTNGSAVELDVHLLNIYACQAWVSNVKARRVLGNTTVVPRQQAMDLTLDWCRYSGLIPTA